MMSQLSSACRPKANLSWWKEDKQVVLETAALQLVATVSDAAYGQGALPEQSYFDRLTLEIAVWPKVVQAAAQQ